MKNENNPETMVILLIQKGADMADSIMEDAKAKGYLSNKTLKLTEQYLEFFVEFNSRLESDKGLH